MKERSNRLLRLSTRRQAREGWGASRPPNPGANLYQPMMTLAHGGGNKVPKFFYLIRRFAVQAAQTPEKSKVFCFFSPEKKALLPSPHHTTRGSLARERLWVPQMLVPAAREAAASDFFCELGAGGASLKIDERCAQDLPFVGLYPNEIWRNPERGVHLPPQGRKIGWTEAGPPKPPGANLVRTALAPSVLRPGGLGGGGFAPPRTSFLVAADEHRVQDFAR